MSSSGAAVTRWTVAIATLLIGVGGAVVALPRAFAPRVQTWVGRPLGWVWERPQGFAPTATVKAGERRLVLGMRGLGPPMVAPGLREGERWLDFPDDFLGFVFDGLEVSGQRAVGVLEGTDASRLLVLESRDGAENFTWAASVPKPGRGGTLVERIELRGDATLIHLRAPAGTALEELWWTPWERGLHRLTRVWPELGASCVLVSTDGGHTFALRR